MPDFPTLDAIQEAANRIGPHIHRTPVLTCGTIDKMIGAEIYFKCENFQKTGAFKFRGALRMQCFRGSGSQAFLLALAVWEHKEAPQLRNLRLHLSSLGAHFLASRRKP